MAFRISRRSWVLGRPCPLGRGRWGPMHSHSASDRSVGYLFLMRARVAKHPPRSTFHTASQGDCLKSLGCDHGGIPTNAKRDFFAPSRLRTQTKSAVGALLVPFSENLTNFLGNIEGVRA